jgi:hypothetical protein
MVLRIVTRTDSKAKQTRNTELARLLLEIKPCKLKAASASPLAVCSYAASECALSTAAINVHQLRALALHTMPAVTASTAAASGSNTTQGLGL